jgi:hypothetical protein
MKAFFGMSLLIAIAAGCGETAPSASPTPRAAPTRLDFSGQTIGPAQLERVPRTATSLGFRSASLSDDQLAQLGELPDLQALDLGYTQITAAGLRALQRFPRLATLQLVGLPIDDSGLEPLLGLGDLRGLNLGDTQITDAGLAKLTTLEHLEWLDLGATKITSRGLESLAKLPKLKRLLLAGVQVDDEAVERLVAARPGLEVHR